MVVLRYKLRIQMEAFGMAYGIRQKILLGTFMLMKMEHNYGKPIPMEVMQKEEVISKEVSQALNTHQMAIL